MDRVIVFKRDCRRFTCWIIISIVLLLFFRVFCYLFIEFIVVAHHYKHETPPHALKCNNGGVRDVPKVIHQVMFNSTIPKPYLNTRENCARINDKFVSTLWNKTMVDDLIESYYPYIKDLYNSYGVWVQRADVARYLIIHRYGGIYIDMDSQCSNSFDDLWRQYSTLQDKVVVRTTTPFGFSNDFIAAPPCHPFMEEVIMSLPHSNRWFIFPYTNIMFSTGPTYFWGRYLNYKKPGEFIVIDNYTHYFTSMHWSSWHRWDGHVVWFVTHNSMTFFSIVFVTVLCVFLCVKKCSRDAASNKMRKV